VILDFFYITLIVFAFLALQTAVLRNAVIYLSVFSLLCSAVYLFLGAPDVAIAEAVIGCTLSTILYLVALKKYKIYSVYYRYIAQEKQDTTLHKQEAEDIKTLIGTFTDQYDLQLDFINTTISYKNIVKMNFDLIIFHSAKGIFVHGLQNSYQYIQLTNYLKDNMSIPVSVFYINEQDDMSLQEDEARLENENMRVDRANHEERE